LPDRRDPGNPLGPPLPFDRHLLLSQKSKEFQALLAPLPLGGFTGRIEIIDTDDEARAERVCAELLASSPLDGKPTVGLDTETRPSFAKGEQHLICLVQLASSDLAGLFRLDLARRPAHAALCSLLERADVVKVGIDLTKELAQIGVAARGLCELRPLCASHGCRALSLRGIAAAHLGLRVSKGQQTSNWEATYLSEAQQRYAATDAWVCLEAYASCAGEPSDEEWRVQRRQAVASSFWTTLTAE
jgi:ribonuclease D